MTVYGYARVSTTDQDLTVQKEALKNADSENNLRLRIKLDEDPSMQADDSGLELDV